MSDAIETFVFNQEERMKKPIKELQHSMQTHIRVAGAITEAMGLVAAKLLDLYEDYFKPETPDHLERISAELIKMLLDSVIERVECYKIDVRYVKSMIPSDPSVAVGFGKPQYLRALACALRELSKATNSDVIDIYDSDGVIQ